MPPPVASSESVEDPGSTPRRAYRSAAASRDVPAPDLPAGTPAQVTPPPNPTARSRRPRSRTSPRWSGRRSRRCIPAGARSSRASPRPPGSSALLTGRGALAGVLATAAVAAFFRNPHRVPPSRTGVVLSPADGTVALVSEVVPPPELDLPRVPAPRVSVFLSVLDVHVQRIPADGRVVDVQYRHGRFLSADLDKASDDNERNALLLETVDGARVGIVQIAGLLARRIRCDVGPGDEVAAGETYGLIRFGSRVDTYLPVGSTVTVEVGQRTIGGETVLARLPGPRNSRARPHPGWPDAVPSSRASVRLLPNAVTVLALCSGLSAVHFALAGRFDLCVAAIVAAAVFDALDGGLARLLDASSKIGAELDSLSDLVAFGVSPALLFYIWRLDGNRLGWVVALVFAVCMALRLARFNTLIDAEQRWPFAKEFFVGVPAPAAALVGGLPLLLWLQFGDGWWSAPLTVGLWALFAAAADGQQAADASR